MSEPTESGDEHTGVGPSAVGVGESRWPMAAAVLVGVFLQVATPHRGRVPGWWLFPVLEIAFLVLIVIQDPGRTGRRSAGARKLGIALISIMTVGTVAGVMVLLYDIVVTVKGVTATVLLGRGAAMWVSNIIVFSLWYSAFDRGGPARRAAASSAPPSFAFAENATPELVPEGWMPKYPDYLYLSFTNSTAFSPTDTLPVRTWAKMTMMVQSVLQLVTAILVIARAINVLPG